MTRFAVTTSVRAFPSLTVAHTYTNVRCRQSVRLNNTPSPTVVERCGPVRHDLFGKRKKIETPRRALFETDEFPIPSWRTYPFRLRSVKVAKRTNFWARKHGGESSWRTKAVVSSKSLIRRRLAVKFAGRVVRGARAVFEMIARHAERLRDY